MRYSFSLKRASMTGLERESVENRLSMFFGAKPLMDAAFREKLLMIFDGLRR